MRDLFELGHDRSQTELKESGIRNLVLNIGLFAMVVISLLPVGLLQTWAAVEYGYWYARSPEFPQVGLIDTLRWLRVVGDTIFAAGVVAIVLFTLGLVTGHSTRPQIVEEHPPGRDPATLPLRS